MRLFFAVELPPEVQAVLARLRPAHDGRDYRWVEPGLLHVTLAFLGHQPETGLPLLREVGEAAAARSPGGLLRLGQAGSFPPKRTAPRVLWVDLQGDLDALHALHTQLAAGLRQAGFGLEDRPFRPHITLARRRESAQAGSPSGWPPPAISAQTEFALRQLTLFESRLSARGPSYIPLFEFQVGPPQGESC